MKRWCGTHVGGARRHRRRFRAPARADRRSAFPCLHAAVPAPTGRTGRRSAVPCPPAAAPGGLRAEGGATPPLSDAPCAGRRPARAGVKVGGLFLRPASAVPLVFALADLDVNAPGGELLSVRAEGDGARLGRRQIQAGGWAEFDSVRQVHRPALGSGSDWPSENAGSHRSVGPCGFRGPLGPRCRSETGAPSRANCGTSHASLAACGRDAGLETGAASRQSVGSSSFRAAFAMRLTRRIR